MNDQNIERNRLTASAVFARAEVEQGKYPVEDMIRQNLARQISEAVQRKALQVIEHGDATEYRMNVYVLSHSELHAMIEGAVRRRQYGMPPSMDTGFTELP